jgi:hypothetical protein
MIDMQEGSEKWSSLLARIWGRYSLFNAWTDVQEHIAAQASANWTLRLAKKAGAGKQLTRSEKGALSRMGLDTGDLLKIDAQMARQGYPGGDLLAANTLSWTDKALALKFEAGIGSDVRRTILRVGAADKPHFMDSLTGQLLFQYQSFAIAASNRMLVAGMQQRDMKLMAGLLSSVWLGAQIRAIKAWLRDDDTDDWSDTKWLAEGIDGAGWIGVYGIGLRTMMMALGDTPTRYLHREYESMGGVLGPTAGNVGNIVRGVSGALEGDEEKAAKYLQRATPFWSNTLHLRQLLEKHAGDDE